MLRIGASAALLCLGLSVWLGRQLGWSSQVGWWLMVIGLGAWVMVVRAAIGRQRRLFDVGLLTIICVCLMARSAMLVPDNEFMPSSFSGQKRQLTGVVSQPPLQRLSSTTVVLRDIEFTGMEADWPYSIQLTLPLYVEVDYGDRLSVIGKVETLETIDDPGYASYLENQHIYGVMIWPTVERLESGQGWLLVTWGVAIEEWATSVVTKWLPRDVGSFLLGIVLGSEQVVSEEFDEALRRTGTSHIVVASGYNISVLVVAVFSVAGYIARGWLSVAAGLLMGGYLLVSGFDPSIVRACIMASLVLLATQWGRQRQAVHLLMLAAMVMLLIWPWWLFAVGFQLSMLATLGLIVFEPMISEKLQARMPEVMAEIVGSTLAAQLLVLPVIVVTFSSLSIVSLLTNLMVLWLIPWLMIGGIILLVVSILSSQLGQWVAYGIYPWLWYVRWIIMRTADWSWAAISLSIDGIWAGFYYVMVWCGQYLWWRRYYEQT